MEIYSSFTQSHLKEREAEGGNLYFVKKIIVMWSRSDFLIITTGISRALSYIKIIKKDNTSLRKSII